MSLGPNFSMRYYLIFIYFFRYSLDVNKRHFLALDPKALGSLKHKLAVSFFDCSFDNYWKISSYLKYCFF